MFLTFVLFVTGSQPNVNNKQIKSVLRTLPPHISADLAGLIHSRKLASLPRVNLGRRLAQADRSTCAWDETAEQCFLTTGTVLDFLDEVDNPLAIYLRRAIPCEMQLNAEDCRAQDCDWNGVYCHIPHREFREFTSAQCLEDIRHIVDLQANALQCTGLRFRNRCENADPCAWLPDTGTCILDRWQYFHGIPLVDGRPQGYDDVYDERLAQLTADLETAQTNGDFTEASDWLDFGPSEFDCPSEYDPMLCDYVDAETSFMLTNAYCASEYPLADEEACSADMNCEPTLYPLAPCGAARTISIDAAREAEEIFAEAIEDSEARKYLNEVIECEYTFEEEDCDGNCVWSNGACLLSSRWAEEEAFRLIGETDNTACQFYASDVTTGCLEHEAVDECTEDRQCVWLGDFNSCESGLYAWLDIALSGTSEEEAFKEAEALCFDSSAEEECSAVVGDSDPADSETAAAAQEEAEEYTYLSGAIGANTTIVGIVF